jgi:hypothetical protein
MHCAVYYKQEKIHDILHVHVLLLMEMALNVGFKASLDNIKDREGNEG